MNKRDTSRDNPGLKALLSRYRWLWQFIQSIPWLKRKVNSLLVNNAIKAMPYRPEPFCNNWDYTTWEGLTNQRWSSRHLPAAAAVNAESLPNAKDLATELFSRGAGGFRESEKSTLVFPYFAQWFVDGFLHGDAVDRRRNA